MTGILPPFPSFDVNPESGALDVRFKKYISRFRNLVIAANITSPKRQRALLLHYAGEEVNNIFETLPDTEAGEGENPCEKAIAALTAYFTPMKNLAYEEYKFREATQESDETLMTYFTRLKQLALTCEFHDADREIKTQIIQHCTSHKLRRKALETPGMTLQGLLDTGKAMELAADQAKTLEEEQHKVSRITRGNAKSKHQQPKQREATRSRTDTKCRNCGGNYPHQGGKTACPAYGKDCRACGKLNHFQSVCMQDKNPRKHSSAKATPTRTTRGRKAAVNAFNEDDIDDHEVFKINVYNVRGNQHKQPMFEVQVAGTPLTMMADSGSSINIVDQMDYRKLAAQPKLEETQVKVYPYHAETHLPVLGKFKTTVSSKTSSCKETFYVVKGTCGSILSWRASQDLELLKTVNPVKATPSLNVEQLTREYDDLFHGLGKLKGYQVKLHIDENVSPVAQPHRRVPFHVRKQLEDQLRRDEELGVIERVEGPTPWVSPLVVAPKPKSPGKIRVCVDMRQANKAVRRERHPTPTIKEVIADLNGSTVFSKLDLNQGYNQLELDPASRYITTFSTHLGLMRFTRLNFGISSAAELFQNTIREALEGIDGVLNISDDILVHGKTQEAHDLALRAVFQRLREKGLTLNRDKCEYSKHKLSFFGYVFSDQGVSADPDKVQDILNLDAPTSVSEVRSLLGMTNYCSRFIKDYATKTEPLRELTHKDHPWEWTAKHEHALSQLKSDLASAPATAYFDPEKGTEISVDASPVGLGAILAQVDPATGEKHVVAYASRSLSDTEQRYSQTEREALAVVWSCEYFHLYIYGQPVEVYTDHKALVAIYDNPKSKPPARIERWALRLQPYQLTVKYRKGEENPADYMSRHPTKQARPESRQEKVAEEYINYIAATSTPKALKLSEIAAATARDPTLQAVIAAVRTGRWFATGEHPNVDNAAFKALEQVKGELTIGSSTPVVLRGTRLVIPAELQKRVVELAHEGHQGITKTKALLREKVWFPGINRLTEERVKSCLACQVATPSTKREPLQMSPLPDRAWQEVSVDFAELSTGDYLLIVTDDYSRYPAVEVIRSLTATTVIPKLDKLFAEFGVPETVRSDNGPPFNGKDFRNFAMNLGFFHRKVTPLWPRANGEVERFVKTVKKVVKTATVEQKPWKEELIKFLRNYRATPHTSTGKAPATALFNHPMRVKLPEAQTGRSDQADIKLQDNKAKRKMKEHADSKSYVKPSNFRVGDTVLVKRDKSYRKALTPYDPEPYEVTKSKGSMVTASNGEKVVTRNSSFFKPLKNEEPDALDTTSAPVADELVDGPGVSQATTEDAGRRYPQRSQRKPPERFKDYVTN